MTKRTLQQLPFLEMRVITVLDVLDALLHKLETLPHALRQFVLPLRVLLGYLQSELELGDSVVKQSELLFVKIHLAVIEIFLLQLLSKVQDNLV